VKLVRDMIAVSRKLIDGESVSFANERFVLRNARIRCNTPMDLPIYVACSGPKMLKMAGELADGVLMLCGATPQTLEYALSHVDTGLSAAHRTRSEIDLAWGAATVISDDVAYARDQSRVMAAWYANHAPAYARQAGVADQLMHEMQGMERGTNLHEARAASAIAPDDMVDQLALAGPAAHIIERLKAAQTLGIEHFELFLIGNEKRRTLERFAAEVMPAMVGTPA
jgi:5,10-methylenetetrahydromethanopterin reductase